MFINKKTGASYAFVAPEISEDAGKDIKKQFPTFGSVEARKVVDHLEADVKRTHTVVTLGEIDELDSVNLNIGMIGEGPLIKLVAKPSTDLPDGSRLTVLLDPNLKSYPRTTIKGFNDSDQDEESEEDESKFKLGLVALILSSSDSPEAPAFVCVVPSVASFLSETLNELMGADSTVKFHGNPVPVNFTLMSGQWVPAETMGGLASVQTTVDGVSELVDRISDAIANNDNGGGDNDDTASEDPDNGGGDNDGTTDNEGGDNDDPTDNEGSGNDDPTGNESDGNDDPTGNEGGDNDDPNNGGGH